MHAGLAAPRGKTGVEASRSFRFREARHSVLISFPHGTANRGGARQAGLAFIPSRSLGMTMPPTMEDMTSTFSTLNTVCEIIKNAMNFTALHGGFSLQRTHSPIRVADGLSKVIHIFSTQTYYALAPKGLKMLM
jgi:hypothetical protein